MKLAFLCLTATALAAAAPRDGQRDFDFEIGAWKTQLRRLVRPLSGSTTWVEYAGTKSRFRVVWLRDSESHQLIQAAVHLLKGDPCPWAKS